MREDVHGQTSKVYLVAVRVCVGGRQILRLASQQVAQSQLDAAHTFMQIGSANVAADNRVNSSCNCFPESMWFHRS